MVRDYIYLEDLLSGCIQVALITCKNSKSNMLKCVVRVIWHEKHGSHKHKIRMRNNSKFCLHNCHINTRKKKNLKNLLKNPAKPKGDNLNCLPLVAK